MSQAERFMARALELARKGLGRTSPNPMVGAVLVKEGRIVGEGYHRRAGLPHAEIEALQDAGSQAQGSTLYINLEPCCHWGRTPPCTQALIQAGVAEVYMAILDPNPLINGQGKEELERAGIATHLGPLEKEARRLNEAFITWVTTGRPFVTAKFAMSLDGKIATRAGDSRWITGEEARQRVHMLRDATDAVMVGINTVLADDPALTTRLDKEDLRHPLRVIVDSQGCTPLTARILDPQAPGQTLIATTELAPPEEIREWEERGARVLVLPRSERGVDLAMLVQALRGMEIVSLLVEGGGTLLASLFQEGLVDKVLAFIAPKIVGGASALTPVEGEGIARMAEALKLRDVEVERLGEDILVSGYVPR